MKSSKINFAYFSKFHELGLLYSFACVNMSKIVSDFELGTLNSEMYDSIAMPRLSKSGEYRIRTDDPLLAKQVL